MDRQLEMISKDKVRTVDIIETGTDSCKICLCSNGFCQVELHTNENLLKLSKSSLRSRPCMKFANYYLKHGIEDKSCYWVLQFLLTNKENMKCYLQVNIESYVKIIVTHYCENYIAWCNVCIENEWLNAIVDPLFRTSYEDVAKLSDEMLLSMLDGWNVVATYETMEQDRKGLKNDNFSAEELYLIRIDDITMFAFNDLIYRLSSGMYLKFVDYYHTHKVLLWDKIPEKIKAKLTKAQLFDKKIVLTSIHADGTPEFMFF
ncbi:hypothetical protein [Roseburia sp. MSJ-14]|uniref:hypothetical protein n=1 Tax=Roseburia sp. MSJ-14 TaxID=2841514 RepID=UPI001C111527|nr:hypothetical protein [Roseburia sp. MSJ-14]MBU5473585.1 hypothetical protein [Roseburia sp. MSJ-14]